MARKYNNAEDFIDDCNMGLDLSLIHISIGEHGQRSKRMNANSV